MSGPCDRLDLATLVDYWFEEDRADDDAIEEHLLDCGACSRRLRGLTVLAEGVSRLARQGAVQMVVTASFLEKAAREGLRAREYRVPPGGRVDCTVTPEDDLLVARLEGNFKAIARLDIVERWEDEPEHRIRDVPVSPDARELILAQAMPAMRALGRGRMSLRLLAQDAGGERLVGEYTFDHAPTRR